MLQKGDRAPNFTLPGVANDTIQTFSLGSRTDQDQAVLLLFFPFDFSPICTKELCTIRDAEWFQLTPDLDVWAISGDSAYAHQAFANEYDLQFPLLSDSHGTAADAYDVRYEEWEGHECVPQRAVILIDSDNTIQYMWQTDNALETPDFVPVKAALDELATARDDFDPADVELSVEYNEEPGQLS